MSECFYNYADYICTFVRTMLVLCNKDLRLSVSSFRAAFSVYLFNSSEYKQLQTTYKYWILKICSFVHS